MANIRRDYARAIWLAMVKDNVPGDELLDRWGFFDAADAVIAFADAQSSGAAAMVEQIRAIVDEPLDERQGHGPTRTQQFARIESLVRGGGR